MNSLLSALLSHPAEVLGFVTVIVGLVLGPSYLKAKLREQRVRMVIQAARIAFGAVEEYARLTETKTDDKLALFGVKTTEGLLAMGEAPLSPEEQPLVRQVADALHAESKAIGAVLNPLRALPH